MYDTKFSCNIAFKTLVRKCTWLKRSELDMPGIMDMTCPTGPIFWILASCSYRILRLKLPLLMLSISSSFCWSSGTASCSKRCKAIEGPSSSDQIDLISHVLIDKALVLIVQRHSFLLVWFTLHYMPRMLPEGMPCQLFRVRMHLHACKQPVWKKKTEGEENAWILSTKEPQSPFPSILPTNAFGLNFSNSCMCSPVPMNVIGLFVAATAPSAPPPLACPSIFVIITLPTWHLKSTVLSFKKMSLYTSWQCSPLDCRLSQSSKNNRECSLASAGIL